MDESKRSKAVMKSRSLPRWRDGKKKKNKIQNKNKNDIIICSREESGMINKKDFEKKSLCLEYLFEFIIILFNIKRWR